MPPPSPAGAAPRPPGGQARQGGGGGQGADGAVRRAGIRGRGEDRPKMQPQAQDYQQYRQVRNVMAISSNVIMKHRVFPPTGHLHVPSQGGRGSRSERGGLLPPEGNAGMAGPPPAAAAQPRGAAGVKAAKLPHAGLRQGMMPL